MQAAKKHVLRLIGARARFRTSQLASQLVRAASADKEEILAALELERWLADSCREALEDRRPGRQPSF